MGSVCSRTVTVKQRGSADHSNGILNQEVTTSGFKVKVSTDYRSSRTERLAEQGPENIATCGDFETDDNGLDSAGTDRGENDSGLCSTSDVIEIPGERNDGLRNDPEDSVLEFNDEEADRNLERNRGTDESTNGVGNESEQWSVVVSAAGHDQAHAGRTKISGDGGKQQIYRTYSASSSQMTPVVLVLATSDSRDVETQHVPDDCALPMTGRSFTSFSRRGSSAGGRISSSLIPAATPTPDALSTPSRLRASSSEQPRQKSAASGVVGRQDGDNATPRHREKGPADGATIGVGSKSVRSSLVTTNQSTSPNARKPATTATRTSQAANHPPNRRRSTRYLDAFAATDKNTPVDGGSAGAELTGTSFDAKKTWRSVRNKVTVNSDKIGNTQSQKKFAARPQSKSANRIPSARGAPQPAVGNDQRQKNMASRPDSRTGRRRTNDRTSDVTGSEQASELSISDSTDGGRSASLNKSIGPCGTTATYPGLESSESVTWF